MNLKRSWVVYMENLERGKGGKKWCFNYFIISKLRNKGNIKWFLTDNFICVPNFLHILISHYYGIFISIFYNCHSCCFVFYLYQKQLWFIFWLPSISTFCTHLYTHFSIFKCKFYSFICLNNMLFNIFYAFNILLDIFPF